MIDLIKEKLEFQLGEKCLNLEENMHSYQLFLFTEFNSLVFHGYRTPGVCYDITFHPQSINISVKHWERNKIVYIFVGIRFPLVL